MSTIVFHDDTVFSVPTVKGSEKRRIFKTYRAARGYAGKHGIDAEEIIERIPRTPPAGMVEAVMRECLG